MHTFLGKLKGVGSLLWRAISLYQTHNVNRLAASVAFYGILSIAPLGVILVTVGGLVYGERAVEGLIVERLQGTMGEEAAAAIQSVLRAAYVSKASIPATAVAFLVLAFGSTRLIGDVRGSLNTIWEVQGRGGGGIIGFLVGKGIDIIAVVVLAGLLLVTMLANTAANAVTHFFAQKLPFPGLVLQAGGIVFSLVVAMAVFVVVFRWLPNIRVGWRFVVLGAGLAAVFFTIGNYVLGFYLGRSSPGSVFGAAGSFVVIMLWMYYSGIIVLFAVELARARWERDHHKKLDDPTPPGMRLSDA